MNKHERTYAHIRKNILDGSYGPGHRLVLDALARELGVSPVPVREALRRLEAEGFIVYRRNVGAQVAPVDDERWEEEMRVLAVLEGLATALATDLLRPPDYKRLRELNAEMSLALDESDMVRFAALNRTWHFTIYGRCPNRYLVEMLGETNERLDALRRTVFTYVPQRGRESLAEHARIMDLLERSAPFDIVEAAARTHKLKTVEAFRDQQAKTGEEMVRK